jgi:hypothetical protein
MTHCMKVSLNVAMIDIYNRLTKIKQDPDNKKRRLTDELESSESGATGHPQPAQDLSQPDVWDLLGPIHSDNTSYIQHLERDALPTDAPLLPNSALELARQAVALVSKTQRSGQDSSGGDVTQGEIERLKAERDEAIAQRDAAVESCRELKRELQQLKMSAREEAERTDRVLHLVTASLQSLRKGSGSVGG